MSMSGGSTGAAVRVGDTVRRHRGPGADLVEQLLVHLERVGFDGVPRFLGVDEEGRQVVSYVSGTATPDPAWQTDDDDNARHLGLIAAMLREMHAATAGFVPVGDVVPARSLPVPGSIWSHGDVHSGNVVHVADIPVALIDWEFAAQADALYDPLSLLTCARLPRPDRSDEHATRERSAALALTAILAGYGGRRRPDRVRARACRGHLRRRR